MTPALLLVKWEKALSVLSLDSLTGVRYLPFNLVSPGVVGASSNRAGTYIVGV